jgi:thiol-disulfide isomerase/thioredoxin
MNRVFYFLLFSLLALSGYSQEKLAIDINFENYYNDTLLVAYYYGNRQLVSDTLIRTEEDPIFHWVGDSLVDQGMYLAVTLPEREFIQFLVPESDQVFNVKTDAIDMTKLEIEGSKENELFLDYVSFISDQRTKVDDFKARLNNPLSTDKDKLEAESGLERIDSEVENYIDQVSAQHPKSITALILNSNKAIDIPEFEGTEKEIQVQQYVFYKKNYFETIDTKHPAIFRTPILDQRMNYYLDKLTPNHPDSIIIAVDYLLGLLEPGSESFQFYLSSYLTQYANSKIVGMDAVYVHIADKYYSEEKTPWVDEENLLLIKDNADDIRPVMLGNQVPDVTFYDEDNRPVKISDIDYTLLVVLFWAPDCGHCKKTMPDFVSFEESYRDKDVKVLAVCTKHKEKTKTCWEAIPEKGMTNFVNVADEFHKSRFKIKFNVKTTPKVFVLDKERTILMKNIGIEQIPSVIDELLNQIK